jgi:stearoyl-CoA desaturase (delta-9 desaturase)
MAPVIIFFISQWFLGGIMQTAFLHRYSAHKQFTMGPTAEKICFILTLLFQGPHYLSAYAYGALHRMHHAHTDTEDDPHSPSYDRSMLAMMWRTAGLYNAILYRKITLAPQFTKDLPDWKAIDQFGSSWFWRIGSGALFVLFYLWAAPPIWMYALLPIQLVSGPIAGAIINWCAHKYGYRNFNTKDTSKNFLPFDFFLLGEAYHNNHHANQRSPNFGVRFFEIDPTYQLLRFLNWIGVIRFKKVEEQAIETSPSN